MALLMKFGTANANILTLLTVIFWLLEYQILKHIHQTVVVTTKKILTHCLIDLETIYHLVGF